MQKKLLITLLTIILITILTFTVHIQLVDATVVTFNMDTLPENQGWRIGHLEGNVTKSISNGILTIDDNPGVIEYRAPDSWNTVNNTKGWIVEFRMRIDPTSPTGGGGYLGILMDISFNYRTIQIEFLDNRIILENPYVTYFMNTTDNFHVYRFEGQGDIIRVFVDEKLAINTVLSNPSGMGASITLLSYGSHAKSYWDYFSYDTNPSNVALTSPTLTVVNGTSSYYISNLTGVTVDNSIISIPNGVYAGWCIDKSVVMARNEIHNIALYSSINTTLGQLPSLLNWNAVNYILNHKQGTMQQIQDAIWYFVPDFVSPPTNEPDAIAMINAALANPNYIPSKGEIMAIIAYTGNYISTPYRYGPVQNTILEYRIP